MTTQLVLTPSGVSVPDGTQLFWHARAASPTGGASPWTPSQTFVKGKGVAPPPIPVVRTSVIRGAARIVPQPAQRQVTQVGTASIVTAVINAHLDIRTGDTVTASYKSLWTKTGWSPWVLR